MRAASLPCLLLLAGLLATGAQAETMRFKGMLSTTAEVPPHPDLKGTGVVEATLDTATRTLAYTATYENLTGKATMAHFHGPAPAGKNAGVSVPVQGALASPISGSATLTDEQVKQLEAGDMYFNIHTDANKAGEVRAQMAKAP